MSYAPSTTSQGSAAIDVDLGFFVLAWVFFLCTPRIELDGQPAITARWGVNRLAVAPGRHQVTCFVPYLFFSRCGASSIVIDVPPGGAAPVRWRAPWIVFLAGRISSPARAVGGAPAQAAPFATTPTAVGFAPAAQAAPPAAGAWHPDPAGRHQLRWFDGSSWTPSVSDDGVTSTDPLAS